MKTILASAVSVILFGVASAAQAAPILAYTSSASQGPNQSYAGGFGMDFTPTAPIEITALGLYSGNTGIGFAGDDFATLFDSSGNVLAQIEFGNGTGNGTLVAGTSDFVKPLSSLLVLAPNQTYTIGAFYTAGVDQLANVAAGATAPAETGIPIISYVGGGRFGGATQNDFPGNVDSGPANRYNGPTFEFAVVPEPSSLVAFCGLGAMVLFFARRNRKN